MRSDWLRVALLLCEVSHSTQHHKWLFKIIMSLICKCFVTLKCYFFNFNQFLFLINIHILNYPDTQLSELFHLVPTSPNNQGLTVSIQFLDPPPPPPPLIRFLPCHKWEVLGLNVIISLLVFFF